MDTLMNQLARELSDAIATAVNEDVRVEACREKARAAGIDMHLSLEAVIGFVNRANAAEAALVRKSGGRKSSSRQQDMTANDRRFLKSLRISAEEPAEKEVE